MTTFTIRAYVVAFAGALALFASTWTPFVQGADPAPIRIASVKAERHRTATRIYPSDLSGGRYAGARQVYTAPEGKVFVTLRAVVEAATPDASIDEFAYKAIRLSIDGKETEPLHFNFADGLFGNDGGSIKFDEGQRRPLELEPMFLVSEDAAKATLSIAGVTTEVDLTGPIVPRGKATDGLQATVESTRIFKELPAAVWFGRYGDGERTTTARAVPFDGKLLAVTFAIQPLAHNDTFLETRWFKTEPFDYGIVLPDGTYATAIGAVGNDGLLEPVGQVNLRRQEDGKYESAQFTLVFRVPKSASAGKLTYFADPIADVEIPEK